MGVSDVIVEWLLRNVRIPTTVINEAVETVDKDDDGYVDLGEVVAAIRRIWREIHG